MSESEVRATKRSTRQFSAIALLAVGVASAASSCQLILGSEGFEFKDTDASAGSGGDAGTAGAAGGSAAAGTSGAAGAGGSVGDAGCQDPNGLDGLGCWACPPTTTQELLNACTTALCKPFDNVARLTKLLPGGGLPPLPSAAGGSGGAGGGGAGGSGGGSGGTGGIPDAGTGNVPCSSLPNPIYAIGGSAMKPFLGELAQTLALQDVTIVYKSGSSCGAVDAIINGTLITGQGTSAPNYWDPNIADPKAAEKRCDLPPEGVNADFGRSEMFASTCVDLPQGLPSTVGDFIAPIQTFIFAVPAASSQQMISGQAAYFVYGFGSDSGVSPWTANENIFKRSASAGSRRIFSSFIGVPVERWQGVEVASADEMVTKLFQIPSEAADSGIGTMSTDTYEANATKLRALAYQDDGQVCAFLPDSTATSRDKRNVRDGHYPLWAPGHYFSYVNAQGLPAKPGVAAVLGYILGTKPYPKGDLLQLYTAQSLIPTCAMRVTRTADGGPLVPFTPEQPCGCRFEFLATGQTSCKSCSTSNDCPTSAPKCSFGYCEP